LVVPQDVSSGPICVRTVIGGKMFSSEKDFYFTVTPKIIAVYPDKAGAGEQVIINGSGFGPTPSIKFGGAEAKIIYSNNVKVAVEVPRGEGECIINFTNTDGQSCEWPFTINKQ